MTNYGSKVVCPACGKNVVPIRRRIPRGRGVDNVAFTQRGTDGIMYPIHGPLYARCRKSYQSMEEN
jgi:hypothetical protein